MTTYAWPAAWRVTAFEAQLVPNTRGFQSPYGGASQSLDLLGERWRFLLEIPGCSEDDAAEREAYMTRLRGSHWVSLWHMKRPAPRGTMRGSPVLASTLAQGASSVSISSAGASATVKAGDLLGVGGMLLQVAEDATANGSGAITINLANRPRVEVASGSAVTWDKPTATFKLADTGGVPMRYSQGLAAGLSLEFIEVW